VHAVVVGNSYGKRTQYIPNRMWKDNIKIDSKKMGCGTEVRMLIGNSFLIQCQSYIQLMAMYSLYRGNDICKIGLCQCLFLWPLDNTLQWRQHFLRSNFYGWPLGITALHNYGFSVQTYSQFATFYISPYKPSDTVFPSLQTRRRRQEFFCTSTRCDIQKPELNNEQLLKFVLNWPG
jgi:hypothetical protein